MKTKKISTITAIFGSIFHSDRISNEKPSTHIIWIDNNPENRQYIFTRAAKRTILMIVTVKNKSYKEMLTPGSKQPSPLPPELRTVNTRRRLVAYWSFYRQIQHLQPRRGIERENSAHCHSTPPPHLPPTIATRTPFNPPPPFGTLYPSAVTRNRHPIRVTTDLLS